MLANIPKLTPMGAVGKPHLPGVESVYLFLKFTKLRRIGADHDGDEFI